MFLRALFNLATVLVGAASFFLLRQVWREDIRGHKRPAFQ